LLNYLQANNDHGAIRAHFLLIPRRGLIKGVNANEINRILTELINDGLINRDDTAAGGIFHITTKGTKFLSMIRDIKDSAHFKFFFIDALDEPTDRVISR